MKKITIGRNTDNDIVIMDQSVSGYHADLEILDNGEMIFRDHSTNGTMVNGNHLHNDFCYVFGTDKIVFPGQHRFDWTEIELPKQTDEVLVASGLQCQPQLQPQPQVPQPLPKYQQPVSPQQLERYGEIGFVGVLKSFWVNYFNFSGRARRKEYWLMAVWNMIFSLIPIIGWLVIIAGCIGYISLAVRRLHDIGRSGLLLLLGLIPFIGSIILFVFYCMDSELGQNKWGASPKYMNN